MSMMLPPDPSQGAGLPIPPGGVGPPGPMDTLNQGPIPGGDGGGIASLLAALGGGGPGGPPDLGPGAGPGPGDGGAVPPSEMSSVEHIQQAMKHLMMALANEPDESQGAGIAKHMAGLQAILGGDQKKQQQLAQLSGPPGGP